MREHANARHIAALRCPILGVGRHLQAKAHFPPQYLENMRRISHTETLQQGDFAGAVFICVMFISDSRIQIAASNKIHHGRVFSRITGLLRLRLIKTRPRRNFNNFLKLHKSRKSVCSFEIVDFKNFIQIRGNLASIFPRKCRRGSSFSATFQFLIPNIFVTK